MSFPGAPPGAGAAGLSNPLGWLGIGTSAAGAVVGAEGSLYQGEAQSNLYNYQASVANINATLAKQDANYATSAGEVSAQEAGMRGRFEEGRIKAGIAAGNIDVSSGSAAKVQSAQTAITQENEGVIRADSAKRAYGFNVKGAMDTAQAGVYKTAAATSLTSGDIGAATSIIGGAGSVSSKWLQGSTLIGSNSTPNTVTTLG